MKQTVGDHVPPRQERTLKTLMDDIDRTATIGPTKSRERYLGIDHYIGRTPLVRLRRLSELTGCEILGKAEFMNPGGSVKDRAACRIIAGAEAAGKLKPGDTIIEGTAGNTGIGLTMVGLARGYSTVIVIPETQSVEKIQLLRTLGARVITVPEKPYSDPGNYNRQAQRLAQENDWFWANQFDNTDNRLAHYETTGPEIWEQTFGGVNGLRILDRHRWDARRHDRIPQGTQPENLSGLCGSVSAPPCGPGSSTGTLTPVTAIPLPKALVRSG